MCGNTEDWEQSGHLATDHIDENMETFFELSVKTNELLIQKSLVGEASHMEPASKSKGRTWTYG
jgi:hypothetical protein